MPIEAHPAIFATPPLPYPDMASDLPEPLSGDDTRGLIPVSLNRTGIHAKTHISDAYKSVGIVKAQLDRVRQQLRLTDHAEQIRP